MSRRADHHSEQIDLDSQKGASRVLVVPWRHVAVIATLLAALSLLTITTSSIGIEALSEDGTTGSGVVVGTPRPVRSDEFQRSTPWRLGTFLTAADALASPLGADPTVVNETPNGDLVESIVLFDVSAALAMSTVVPDAIVFALLWWLPLAVLASSLVYWLRVVFEMNLWPAYVAVALVLLSPATAWWSLWPAETMAWIVATVAVMAAFGRLARGAGMRWWGWGLPAISGLLLARAAFTYQPWAVPLAIVMIAATIAATLLPRDGRSRVLAAWFVMLLVFGALAFLTVMENEDGVSAIAGSVYPGGIRSATGSVSTGVAFGAQHLGILTAVPEIRSGNESELSSAYTILGIPALVLLLWMATKAPRRRPSLIPAASLVLVAVLMSLWFLVDVPSSLGSAIPVFNRIPPSRLAQVIGFPLSIGFVALLTLFARELPTRSRLSAGAGSAAAAFGVSVFAGMSLRSTAIPSMGAGYVWVVSAITGAVIAYAVARYPRPDWALPILVGALLVVLGANPVMRGLGDLRSGSMPEIIRALVVENPEARWISDTPTNDAVLMANGAPGLSGQQWAGPDREAWATIDPTGRFEDAWNRGASYIIFGPEPEIVEPVVEALADDVIRILMSPCHRALPELGVRFLLSSGRLDLPCLSEIGLYTFSGTPRFIYSIEP